MRGMRDVIELEVEAVNGYGERLFSYEFVDYWTGELVEDSPELWIVDRVTIYDEIETWEGDYPLIKVYGPYFSRVLHIYYPAGY